MKKRLSKKILGITMAFILTLSAATLATFCKTDLLPFVSFSAKAAEDEECTYTVKNNTVTITGCNDSAGYFLTIPSSINGLPVTTIGSSAFSKSKIQSITIPASVTTIEDSAFYNCANLKTVTFESRNDSQSLDIGGGAFANCTALSSINLED